LYILFYTEPVNKNHDLTVNITFNMLNMNILIDWSEEYSVNIKKFDQQHKKLFDLINFLNDSLIRNEDDDILEQILSDLIDYTFVHFKEEEKYFTSSNLHAKI